MHALLLLALVVGPAFFNRPTVADPTPVLEFIPIVATDENFKGGGAPRAAERLPEQPTQVTPPTQPVAPPPEPVAPSVEREEKPPRPEPVKKPEPEKPTRPDRDAPAVSKEKPRHQVTVSKNKVPLSNNKTPSAANNSTAKQPTSSANNELASALARVGSRVRSGLSSATQVDMPEGPGGGGVSYANYGQIVRKIYTDAWRVPDDMADDEANIKVSVTIARDGTVLSSRIVQASGSAAADRSIQNTLNRISSIGVAFPAGAKESERTFILTFNLKAKKAFG